MSELKKPLKYYLARHSEKVKQPLILNHLITVTVTDENGQPVAGALVRTKFTNDRRKATTDKDGKYRLVGCREGMARVVVSAKGKALDLKQVRVETGMA